jgi:hypothetical protein
MNRLLIVGFFWIISTAPLFAQAQQPDAAKLKVAAPHRGLTTSPQGLQTLAGRQWADADEGY